METEAYGRRVQLPTVAAFQYPTQLRFHYRHCRWHSFVLCETEKKYETCK